MGLYESIQRSQRNIDSLSGSLRNHMEKQREVDQQNKFYDALRRESQPTSTTENISPSELVPSNENVTGAMPAIPTPNAGRAIIPSPSGPTAMALPLKPQPTAGAAGIPTSTPPEQRTRQITGPPVGRMEALRAYLMKNPEALSDPTTKELIAGEIERQNLISPQKQFGSMGPGATLYDKATGKPEYTAPGRPGGTAAARDRKLNTIVGPNNHQMVKYQRPDNTTYTVDEGEARAPQSLESKTGSKIGDEERKSVEKAKEDYRTAQAGTGEYESNYDIAALRQEMKDDKDYQEIIKKPSDLRETLLLQMVQQNPQKAAKMRALFNYEGHKTKLNAAEKRLKDKGVRFNPETDEFEEIGAQPKKKVTATQTDTSGQEKDLSKLFD